jgi:hypothetical protein
LGKSHYNNQIQPRSRNGFNYHPNGSPYKFPNNEGGRISQRCNLFKFNLFQSQAKVLTTTEEVLLQEELSMRDHLHLLRIWFPLRKISENLIVKSKNSLVLTGDRFLEETSLKRGNLWKMLLHLLISLTQATEALVHKIEIMCLEAEVGPSTEEIATRMRTEALNRLMAKTLLLRKASSSQRERSVAKMPAREVAEVSLKAGDSISQGLLQVMG